MSGELAGICLAVIGGDDRELILLSKLVELEAEVTVVGFDTLNDLPGNLKSSDFATAVKNVRAIILPMPGTDEKGEVRAVYAKKPVILDEKNFALINPGTPIFVGIAKKYLLDLAEKYNLPLKEIAEWDEIAILNSIPTAEGAIEIAIHETQITIHGSKSLIFGFGRIGITLARMLQGLGAGTYIVARKASDLARAYELGYTALNYEEVKSYLSRMDIIFNTVPHPVINKEYLELLKKDCLIIDLASTPGGTDFPAAERLGIKAILAPGLPGKVAPKTAGQILARVYPKLILEQVSLLEE